ncbi:MAG: mitochondrial carrier domain-containing protein [Benjaminiella poitrasii]|nr:MAG: mitochondrial carrier domain-containing protein [Benjaminiella poitrasii]
MSTTATLKMNDVTVNNTMTKKDTKSYVHFIAGGVGGLVGAVCTSPLDVVKTRLQSTFYQQGIEKGIKHDSARSIWSHFAETSKLLVQIKQIEGIQGYFKGLGPNLVGVIPARAINFYTYGNGKRIFTELNHGKETSIVHLTSAATAGMVTATATNPIWVIKTRLQLQGKQRVYTNSLHCTVQILKQEGIKGLYKGMSASYLGVAEGTIQWVIYERLKKKWAYSQPPSSLVNLNDKTLTVGGKSIKAWMGNLSAAAVAKLVAACVAYPHEVIRTRLREPIPKNGIPKYTGLLQCLKLIVKEEGFIALYGGMSAHLMRVVPNAAIMFFCYEAIVHNFGQQK